MTGIRTIPRRDILAGVVSACLISENLANPLGAWATEPSTDRPLDPAKHRGLRVIDGEFHRHGQRYSGVGINYFDCFTKLLARDVEKSSQALERWEMGLVELKRFRIPFVRFNAGAFYPKDWDLYEVSPDEYYSRFDAFIRLAEKYEVGLIPSLFWTFFTQPVLAKEPLSSWGIRGSATHVRVNKYIQDTVLRYRDSPAIWAWEFGNEYNLEIDLPNQTDLLRRWYQPSLGMPSSPGPDDRLSGQDLRIALEYFGETIRKYDPYRAIFSGNASPRSSAWHLQHHGTWDSDSIEQWEQTLELQNPNPLDATSIHFYPFHEGDGTGVAGSTPERALEIATLASKSSGKPLWVGEFGTSPTSVADERAEQFKMILTWLKRHSISLSAAWVYDYTPQPDHNLALPENRLLLEMLAEANA